MERQNEYQIITAIGNSRDAGQLDERARKIETLVLKRAIGYLDFDPYAFLRSGAAFPEDWSKTQLSEGTK